MRIIILSCVVFIVTACGGNEWPKINNEPKKITMNAATVSKAGDEAINCGSSSIGFFVSISEIEELSQCAIDAFYMYQPFYVEFDFSLVGGLISENIAYDGEKMYFFETNYWYCADPSKDCRFYYSERECSAPVVVEVDRDEDLTGLPFKCSSTRTEEESSAQ